MKYVREGIDWLKDPVDTLNPTDIQTFYTGLWSESPAIAIPFDQNDHDMNESSTEEILSAITNKEIKTRLSKIKNGSAPGPDGMEKRHLNQRGTREALRLFFNLLLITQRQPRTWNENKTILMPKPGKDPNNIENLRPITISPILCRMYWGIIDQRLRANTKFSQRQKGFVSEPGCFYNIHALNEILRLAKTRQGLVLIQLDISKAFDTIPHKAIDPALRRLGIPSTIRSSIINSYQSIHTNIEHKGSRVGVQLRRGVKQGDPLSPFLFNTIMNPLLDQLEEMRGYKINESQSISSLAFADDLILVADNMEKAQLLLTTTEKYLENMGMKIASKKCTSLQVQTTKDSWYISNTDLHLTTGNRIPSSNTTDITEYLGGH